MKVSFLYCGYLDVSKMKTRATLNTNHAQKKTFAFKYLTI